VETAARQILRALRGNRSQLQFSRWLGYRSNVVADWEGGHRFPSGAEWLRAAARVGVDVPAALARFSGRAAESWSEGEEGLARWLDALRGTTSQLELAARVGASRHQVGRWLSGRACPRLPDLLSLVDGMTGRVQDLAAEIVDIEAVPSMVTRHQAARRARSLAWDQPWALAVLMLVDVGIPVDGGAAHVAARLGLDEAHAQECISMLVAAGLIAHGSDGRWSALSAPSLSTAEDARAMELRRFWAAVACARIGDSRDVHSYNLFSVSAADLDRIRSLQRAYFRELRGIVAASTPAERIGLVVLQVCELA
jgi:DNA-binding transcriptional regulator YiaG